MAQQLNDLWGGASPIYPLWTMYSPYPGSPHYSSPTGYIYEGYGGAGQQPQRGQSTLQHGRPIQNAPLPTSMNAYTPGHGLRGYTPSESHSMSSFSQSQPPYPASLNLLIQEQIVTHNVPPLPSFTPSSSQPSSQLQPMATATLASHHDVTRLNGRLHSGPTPTYSAPAPPTTQNPSTPSDVYHTVSSTSSEDVESRIRDMTLPVQVGEGSNVHRYKCSLCLNEFSRWQDCGRHIKSKHLKMGLFVCCGVPIEDARGAGIPEETIQRGEHHVYNGRVMVGGCQQTFARKDIYQRHLKKSVKCLGDSDGTYHTQR